jgi:YHS domain-containing protein
MDRNLQMATATDPVCGMEVNVATAQLTFDHDGKTYYFCSRGCMLDFQDEPAKFLDAGYTPGMEGMAGH